MNTKRLFALACVGFAAIALFGCAALDAGNQLAAFKYTADDKGEAIVLISAGSPESCLANPMSIRLLADGVRSPMLATALMGFNSKMDTSMYPDHQGVLSALRVPAGHYRVMPFPFNAVNFRPAEIPVAEFSANGGEVVYVGEIYLPTACQLSTRVEYRDAFDRDMALLKRLNPALAQSSIQKRLLVPVQETP